MFLGSWFNISAVNYGIIPSSREAQDAARGDSPENELVAAMRPPRRTLIDVASTLHVVLTKY